MVDLIVEIPLPGRIPASIHAGCRRESAIAIPSFVAGPENHLVATAINRLIACADRSQKAFSASGWNGWPPPVLAMFGPPGTGKTHLARSLVAYWQQHRGDDAAEYITATDFRRQLTAAMSDDCVNALRKRWRNRDLLAIDGLQQLPDDAYLMQELRYTLDAVAERGGMVVVASHRPAAALANLTADVCARLTAGLTLQLAAPGMAARLRIVQHASQAMQRPLSDDAIRRLAAGLRGTANRLVGALYELFAESDSTAATSAVDQLVAARRPELTEIISLVAKYFSQSQKQLRSGSRKRSIVTARAIAVFLARDLTNASYEQIGRALGGRDHSTVMHNYGRIKHELQHDLAVQQAVADLRRMLLCR